MVARKHHYIPQFYLRNFLKKDTKKNNKLTVIDFENEKIFFSPPRGVACQRDFNRVEAEGVDPNIIEKQMCDLETEVSISIQEIDRTKSFEGQDKDNVLLLMALIAFRNPKKREQMAEFNEEMLTRTTLSRLESSGTESAKLDPLLSSVDEDQIMHELIKDGEVKIEVTKEFLIDLEFKGAESIESQLHRRKWCLAEKAPGAGDFITSDNPVCLVEKVPSVGPSIFGIGFGTSGTTVFFTLSK